MGLFLSNKMEYYKEKIIEKGILLLSFSAVSILLLITFFIFKEGTSFILGRNPVQFILSVVWSPGEGKYGILPMILGSFCVTFGALTVGVPLGVACAIFLVEFSNKKIRTIVKPAIELLAGIPSVVYGFMGIMVLAPIIRTYLGGSGLSVLCASLVLGIMILPTVISISMDALMALPPSYKEGSLAMGATLFQTVTMVLLPAARSGIFTGVILGMGRAIGETMAVIMVAGNAIKIPSSILAPVRTLTANIALEMGYAIGDHRRALFATALVLFVFILFLNILAMVAIKRRQE